MSHTIAKKTENLPEGPILSKLLMFALPLIATSVLQLLFNTADTIVVGRWGGSTPEECETALAAVGSCSYLIALLVNFFLGLSVGAGICVAHDIGAKQYDGVRKTVHTSVVVALFSGTLIMVVGLCFAKPLLLLMGTHRSVVDEAVPYMCAYFCGMPASMLYSYCAAILRSNGDTARPLLFLSAAGVTNVVLNLIMVLVFQLGALGVGIATAVSNWVSCILIVVYMMRMDGPCKIVQKQIGIDKQKMKRMLAIGLPAGIQSTFFSLSNVLVLSSINTLGKSVVAGNTAAGNLEGYIYVTQNAFQQAAMTFVGQQHGGGEIYPYEALYRLDRCRGAVLWRCGGVVLLSVCYSSARHLQSRQSRRDSGRLGAPDRDHHHILFGGVDGDRKRCGTRNGKIGTTDGDDFGGNLRFADCLGICSLPTF